MATYRLEFDANGEPELIEEENGSFKTPMNDLQLPEEAAAPNVTDWPEPHTQRAA